MALDAKLVTCVAQIASLVSGSYRCMHYRIFHFEWDAHTWWMATIVDKQQRHGHNCLRLVLLFVHYLQQQTAPERQQEKASSNRDT